MHYSGCSSQPLFVICIIEWHMHVLPRDTLPSLAMQQGS